MYTSSPSTQSLCNVFCPFFIFAGIDSCSKIKSDAVTLGKKKRRPPGKSAGHGQARADEKSNTVW